MNAAPRHGDPSGYARLSLIDRPASPPPMDVRSVPELVADALSVLRTAGIELETLELDAGFRRHPQHDHLWYAANSGTGASGRPWLMVTAGNARETGDVSTPLAVYKSWESDRAHQSHAETAEIVRQMEAATRKREHEAAQAHARAADDARGIWKTAQQDVGAHPYLKAKRVRAHGIRLHGNRLLVPVADAARTIHGLQSIAPDGAKHFNPGAAVRGHFHLIGEPAPGGRLYLAEGYATGATIHEATGAPVAIGFNAGNLTLAAKALRAAYPDAMLIVAGDQDAWTKNNPGATHARAAAEATGATLVLPRFRDTADQPTDFNDLARLEGAEVLRAQLESPTAEVPPAASAPADDATPDDEKTDSREKTGQATALVAFALDRVELFHDLNKDVYATDRETGETRRIDGRSFRDWLVSAFYQAEAKAARDQSIREALSTLSGIGRFRGEQREVWVRVAVHDGVYYLDLAETGQSRAVCIAPGAWTLVSDPPVRFVRPESAQPLPEPERGGRLADLWRFANVPPELRLLVLAWLAECLRPDTPFPVLELIGEQGSAKSTTQTALRRLIDPNACDLRAAPKSVEDAFVSAGTTWLASYENVSHLSAPMQDAFCVLATGGGFAKRKLYTDADESVITVKRPVILNGIGAAITAQDLIDRTVSIETPRVGRRVEVTTLWVDFQAHHARLLGALLDAMAGALARLPDTVLPEGEQPRLVEFARLGAAVAETLGERAASFHSQFRETRAESIARTIDASPVASALIDWFDGRGRKAIELSVKDLFREVETKKPPGSDAWPRTAKGFADALRRAAPALRQLGIECRSQGKRGGNIVWSVAPGGYLPNPSPASPDVLATGPREQDMGTCRTSAPELSPADDDPEVF